MSSPAIYTSTDLQTLIKQLRLDISNTEKEIEAKGRVRLVRKRSDAKAGGLAGEYRRLKKELEELRGEMREVREELREAWVDEMGEEGKG